MRKYKSIYVFFVFLVFYGWLAGQIPFCHDDWEWGIDIGIERWISAEQNSRYLGNFIEIIMTRSVSMKVLIMGIFFVLIPCLVMRIISVLLDIRCAKTKSLLFLLCNILLLTMDREIWKQACGWIAGFANFTISAVFVLYLILDNFSVLTDQESGGNTSLKSVLYTFFIALAGQLFLENLAIYVVLFAVLLCMVSYFKFHSISNKLMAMLAGSIIGIMIMFSSSLYDTLLSTGEAINGYRRLYINSEDSIMRMAINCIKQFIRLPYWLWENNLILSLGILAVMSIRIIQKEKNANTAKTCLVLNGICAVYFVWHNFYALPGETQMYQSVNGMADITFHAISFSMNMLYFLIIIVGILLTTPDKRKRIQLFFFWLSAPITVAPLIFISEYGQRLFFFSNTLQMVFLGLMICDCLQNGNTKSVTQLLTYFTLVAAILMCHYVKIYSDIGSCMRQRGVIIQTAQQEDMREIVLPIYPHLEYLHYPDPTGESWEVAFKQFYGIDDSVIVRFE